MPLRSTDILTQTFIKVELSFTVLFIHIIKNQILQNKQHKIQEIGSLF